MVKTKGTILSIDAAGSIGDALTFSGTTKRRYAKRKHKPANPRTQLQLTTRANIKWLSAQWKNVTEPERATWLPLSQQWDLSPYQTYLKYNARRWSNFLFPSTAYPATETGYVPKKTNTYAYDGVAMISIKVGHLIQKPDWGWCLFRDTAPYGFATYERVVAFFPVNPLGFTWYYDTPLAPGTYYYLCLGFHKTGKIGPAWSLIWATAS